MPTASMTKKRPNGGTAPKVSVFKNANKPHIKNSSFTVHNTTNVDASADPLDILHQKVATNAILNAGGRADEVKCYPGTRKEVISLIERWISEKEGAMPNMLWLSGPAGAGKSAIVQTIAERCKERGVQAASFFFFRADPTRNSAKPLVATLLYQIFKFCPPARHAVANILSNDPLIFGASIHDQFTQLLSVPIQDSRPSLQSPARRPIVLLIDGLDECDSETKQSQSQILKALEYLLTQKDSVFLALVASRTESQITGAFNRLACAVQSIFLDDQYHPENDIRLFVNEKFNEIKKWHHLAHTLEDNWPSVSDKDAIVKKSSGQFIFVATVMRFIANSSASPQLSLERVQGISPAAHNSPFAQLDAIYLYILSQAEDQEAVRDILSAELLIKAIPARVPVVGLLKIYSPVKYTNPSLQSCASDLSAILRLRGEELVVYHASLTDFLKDKSRSGEYHADIDVFGSKILPMVWANAETHEWKIFSLDLVHRLKKSTLYIADALQEFSALYSHYLSAHQSGIHYRFMFDIHRLYYPQDTKTYKRILRDWVSFNVAAGVGYKEPTMDLPYARVYCWFYRGKKWLRLL